MILSGEEIAFQSTVGQIEIDPTDGSFMNPASWDLRLGSEVAVYRCGRVGFNLLGYSNPGHLDSKIEPEVMRCPFDEAGLEIAPGMLYLLHTLERIRTDHYVPIIDGKSSIGRLGLIVHCTAGYGDPGFDGQYTLEVTSVAHVVRVYPGMRFCQVRFHTIEGKRTLYDGNYKGEASRGPVPSASWRQFAKAGS